MSAVVGIVVRLLGLFGVSLSPFWAGAVVMGLVTAALGGAGLHLYNAGYASADAAWRAQALQARIDTLEADRDVANRAAAEARLRAAAIEQESNAEKEGTAAYVDELKAKFQAACAIDDDDLRGMHAGDGAGRARARPAAGARWFAKPDAGAGAGTRR